VEAAVGNAYGSARLAAREAELAAEQQRKAERAAERQQRLDARHADWQATFLEVFAKCGSRSKAAKAAGVSVRTVKNRELEGGEFAEALAEAKDAWIEHLESLLYDQAKNRNNALSAMMLLKRWAPELYEERLRLEANIRSLNANVVINAEDAKGLLRQMLADATDASRAALTAAIPTPAAHVAALPPAAGDAAQAILAEVVEAAATEASS
jgi:hypothetical protein